jgi:neutral ceramidase
MMRTSQLLAGAAKVDVTPQDLTGLTNLWRNPFDGVHDRIYLRALVVDNGINAAAIVASDLLEYGDTQVVRDRVAQEVGIPADHIIITASHAHNTPRVGSVSPGASAYKGGPATQAYTKVIYDQIVAVVQQAKAALQPARVGIDTGQADANTNRDEYTADGWLLGVNPNGPSDKTLWVVKFETMSGDPLAILMNYAVHAVVLGPENTLVTGDLAGAAERYVEQYYDDQVVALWTIGAAGDQNPKYMSWDTTYSQKDREPGYPLMNALGQIVGEEVVRVADRIDRMTPMARIEAEGRVISCPASPSKRQRGGENVPQVSSLDIYLGLVMINHIAITSVSGEVATNIYYHLKRDSPFTNTIIITMANDRIGYIVEDAAYDTPTFEAMGTPLQPGTAEKAIVHGLVEMMSQY